ncbi:hypothetical protein IT157_04365 [bacterium]|nr:hypothetical protein [bacterium]
MTPSKPGLGTELVEPLRNFLESFTQELTEQQFIPAFRDELGKLAQAFENIQQAGDTLQQVARGVDRLRDVFAPAGTRMLDGVKELEAQMRSNSDLLRTQANEVLTQLQTSHSELETALRRESGLLGDHSSAGREAVMRISGEVEERLSLFSQKLDQLCARAEQELGQFSALAARSSEPAAPVATAAPQQVATAQITLESSEELKSYLSRAESSVADELSRHSSEIRELLNSNTKESQERLTRLDKTIDEALRAVAPRVQSELDSALTRLRDQMDAIVRAEREALPAPVEQHQEQAPATVVITSLTSTENRLLREFDELRKSGTSELTEIQKGLANLALDLAEITEKQTERVEKEQQTIKESLIKVDRMLKERAAEFGIVSKHLGEGKQQLEALKAQQAHSVTQLTQLVSGSLEKMGVQAQLAQHVKDAVDSGFSTLKTNVARIEEYLPKTVEQAVQESRAVRERIEAALNDLRGKLDGRFDSSLQKSEESLKELATSWAEQYRQLKGDIEKKLDGAGDILKSDLEKLAGFVREQTKQQELRSADLSDELIRAHTILDERMSKFESSREENEQFSRAIEQHVKVVASEVTTLRSKSQEQLEVLKEAIRANYDDNSARLKEVIDGGFDRFLEQIRTVPQALERYSKFTEAMHQSSQLALQGISGDTANLLTLAKAEFEEIRANTEAQKKLFPLINKSLEKHGGMLEGVRRAQAEQDKALDKQSKYQHETRDELTRFLIDLKGEIRRVEGAEQTRLTELDQMLHSIYGELEKLQRNDLPAFRRELINLIQSKFDFIESTNADRQNAFRAELTTRLEEDRKNTKKMLTMIAGLVGLGVLVQFALHYRLFSF